MPLQYFVDMLRFISNGLTFNKKTQQIRYLESITNAFVLEKEKSNAIKSVMASSHNDGIELIWSRQQFKPEQNLKQKQQ